MIESAFIAAITYRYTPKPAVPNCRASATCDSMPRATPPPVMSSPHIAPRAIVPEESFTLARRGRRWSVAGERRGPLVVRVVGHVRDGGGEFVSVIASPTRSRPLQGISSRCASRRRRSGAGRVVGNRPRRETFTSRLRRRRKRGRAGRPVGGRCGRQECQHGEHGIAIDEGEGRSRVGDRARIALSICGVVPSSPSTTYEIRFRRTPPSSPASRSRRSPWQELPSSRSARAGWRRRRAVPASEGAPRHARRGLDLRMIEQRVAGRALEDDHCGGQSDRRARRDRGAMRATSVPSREQRIQRDETLVECPREDGEDRPRISRLAHRDDHEHRHIGDEQRGDHCAPFTWSIRTKPHAITSVPRT